MKLIEKKMNLFEVDDKYYIEEYDGKETVVTPDVVEKWWINV